MYSWVKLSHLVHWSGGKLLHPPKDDPAIHSISSDTRTLQAGEVFLALRGDNFDGHNYLKAAQERRALALISEKEVSGKTPVIHVKDSLQAFIMIAEKLRESFRGPVFAVTGSAGKSSTRDMVAILLGRHVLKAPASFNNLLGVSKTICLIDDATEKLVLEMGMNALGEIKEMCDRFHPLAGLITNVGDAHIGRLGSQENVFRAKKELFDSIGKSQKAIGVAVNLDDPYVVRAHQETIGNKLRAVTYSLKDPKAAVFISDYQIDPDTCHLKVKVNIGKDTIASDIPIFGLHHAENIAGAIAAAILLGVSTPDIEARLPGISPADHRGVLLQSDKYVTIVDESYNSNPTALKSSLDSLWKLDPARRRVLVIGEMREMGTFTEKVHRETGREIVNLYNSNPIPFVLVAVGKDAKWIAEEVHKELPGILCAEALSFQEAEEITEKILKAHDILFVKGSHGVRLDLLVDYFSESFR
jgi:UDP-N-acetylmuramoyl-tripeptide--D-alanyl-D-alanine ligase